MNMSKELADKHSMYEGLDELQTHFLREELKQDHRRSLFTLRRIAKRKAIGQRIKWKLEETLVLFGICGFIAACVFSILVWNL